MSSRNRILDVLNHRIPDRVPVWEALIDPPMVEYILGIKGENSSMLEPANLVRLYKKIGLDGIICGMKFFRPVGLMSGKQIPIHAIPRPSQTEIDFYLERIRKTVRIAHEEGLAVAAYTHGAFDVVYESLGFENFMYLLMDDYDYVCQVTDLLFSHHLQSARDAIGTGIDWFVVGDDIAFKTGIFLNPDMFLDLWKERETRLIHTVRAAGLPVEFHTDGKVDFVLPHLVEMGVSLTNPVEPYSNNIRELKRSYAGKLGFRGNLDIAGSLAFGTPEDCYKEAAELVRDLAPGGGYVFSTSHSIASGVKPMNYLAALKAVTDFGTY